MRKTGPSKADTSLLEPFAGLTLANIIVPRTEAEFAAAAQDIRAARQVGFDTESKPTFRVGEVSTGPHVVQFALPGRAYIFQLHHAACVPVVAALLQDRAVLKIGFGLSSDHSQIRAKLGISPCAVLDLNTVYRKLGYNSSMGARGGRPDARAQFPQVEGGDDDELGAAGADRQPVAVRGERRLCRAQGVRGAGPAGAGLAGGLTRTACGRRSTSGERVM